MNDYIPRHKVQLRNWKYDKKYRSIASTDSPVSFTKPVILPVPRYQEFFRRLSLSHVRPSRKQSWPRVVLAKYPSDSLRNRLVSLDKSFHKLRSAVGQSWIFGMKGTRRICQERKWRIELNYIGKCVVCKITVILNLHYLEKLHSQHLFLGASVIPRYFRMFLSAGGLWRPDLARSCVTA